MCVFLAEIQSMEECGQQLKRILDSPSVPQANHQLLVHLTRHLSKVAQSGGAAQASPRLLALAYSEAIFKHNHFRSLFNQLKSFYILVEATRIGIKSKVISPSWILHFIHVNNSDSP